MMDRIKNELLNMGLKFISVDEKIVRLFLETSSSNVNEIVILPAVKMVMKKIISKLQNKRAYGRVYNGLLNGINVSVIRSMIGAPNCAITIESLKRCKTKIIIRVDFCGGIENASNDIKIGDIIIPKRAYCGDGTSPQYFMKHTELLSLSESIQNPISQYQQVFTGNEKVFITKPHDELKDILINETNAFIPNTIKEVDLWTTDSLFCETYDFIKSLRSINVEAIDMETSILFLLAKLYNLKAISILSVSDLPGNPQYDFLKSNEISLDLEKGIDNAIKFLIRNLPKIKTILS